MFVCVIVVLLERILELMEASLCSLCHWKFLSPGALPCSTKDSD